MAYSKHVKDACRADYRKFCSEWKSESDYGRLCMFNHRFELSKKCQWALLKEKLLESYFPGKIE